MKRLVTAGLHLLRGFAASPIRRIRSGSGFRFRKSFFCKQKNADENIGVVWQSSGEGGETARDPFGTEPAGNVLRDISEELLKLWTGVIREAGDIRHRGIVLDV